MGRPDWGAAMDIVEATQSYESWLARKTALVASELSGKHDVMDKSAFGFLRATYYRWVQVWPEVCGKLATAPKVLSVGDLHAENFGTWRDEEARLVWGINDFDEAHRLPYTADLVRLAASLLIAIEEEKIACSALVACNAVLAGYDKAMAGDTAAPFVLEEHNQHLRALALSDNRKPSRFWKKLAAAKNAQPPRKLRKLLRAHLPKGTHKLRFAGRVAGAGGLGLARFVAIGKYDGGYIAREAKARAPTALAWAGLGKAHADNYRAILDSAVRAPDPCLWLSKHWLVRRLAPHCERIELKDVSSSKQLKHLFEAMGAETANVHRGSRKAVGDIRADLRRRSKTWLHRAAAAMADATRADWEVWKKRKKANSE